MLASPPLAILDVAQECPFVRDLMLWILLAPLISRDRDGSVRMSVPRIVRHCSRSLQIDIYIS